MTSVSRTSEHRPRREGGGPPRRTIREIEVIRSVRLSPNVQRVTFTGSSLRDFSLGTAGGHVKLFLPPPGTRSAVVPSPSEQTLGATRPEGPVRTYTPRRFDPATRELDIDLVLHGDGPGARWAAESQPGDRIGLAGPGRGYEPDPHAEHFLLAGDETAIAAIAAIVAALPARAVARVLVEVPTTADAQDLTSPAELDVTWLERGDRPAGTQLEPALHELNDIVALTRVWVAAEAGLVRRLREHLQDDRGLPDEHLTIRGYWKHGTANHPDNDYGAAPRTPAQP